MTAVLDRRATGQVGRHARFELVFAVRHGRTVLAHSYAEPPFRTGRCFAEGDALHMILASSSPGVFGGDHFDQMVVLEEGARVRLTSQSAPQLHAAPTGASAVLRSTYRVAERAHLSCHWDPLIPFAGASLDQRIELNLAATARLYWGDAMMSGRAAHGERWLFTAITHELRILQAGRLTYLERFRMAPAERPIAKPWIADEAAFFATAIAAGTECVAAGDAERLHTILGEIAGVRASADEVEPSLLVVRMMGALGVPFHRARAVTLDACSR
jgi:urease accessory protein